MQVKELIEALRKAPPDAYVVISGDIIHGIEVIQGKIEVGYYNPVFFREVHGKDKAVVFLANGEISTGEVLSLPK